MSNKNIAGDKRGYFVTYIGQSAGRSAVGNANIVSSCINSKSKIVQIESGLAKLCCFDDVCVTGWREYDRIEKVPNGAGDSMDLFVWYNRTDSDGKSITGNATIPGYGPVLCGSDVDEIASLIKQSINLCDTPVILGWKHYDFPRACSVGDPENVTDGVTGVGNDSIAFSDSDQDSGASSIGRSDIVQSDCKTISANHDKKKSKKHKKEKKSKKKERNGNKKK